MENKMSEVAKLLGVELDEEFKIDGLSYKYKLTKDGLVYLFDNGKEWFNSCWLGELLTGKDQLVKIPKPILDDKEKEYLSNIIKPFRNKVKSISKYKKFSVEYEYICIRYLDSTEDSASMLPDFKAGTMYRGMKNGKRYTLEELGL